MSDPNFDYESGFGSQNNLPLDDFINTAPPRSGFPWKWVIIGVAIVAVIGILVGVGIFLWPKIIVLPPEKTVEAYYQALNEEDLEKASSFMDHSAGEVVTDMPITFIKKQINELSGGVLNASVDIGIEFQGLSFQTLTKDKTTATVEVKGHIRITEINSNFNLSLPYNWTHELTYQNGKWLIKP